jgi:hypothetical protein
MWTLVLHLPVGHIFGLLNIFLMVWGLVMKVLERPLLPHLLFTGTPWAEVITVVDRK